MQPPVRVVLVRYSAGCLRVVAAAARMTVSKKPVETLLSMPGGEVEEWLRELIRRGHGSPLEHCTYTFLVECSRACSHQLVRHRIASYTQQSMRYTEGFLRETTRRLCVLTGVDCPERPGSQRDYAVYAGAVERALGLLSHDATGVVEALSHAFTFPPGRDWVGYARAYLAAMAAYYRLLAQGARMEDARMVLPQAVRTRLVVTMNARELFEVFLPLRMCTRAQWEIRLAAWMLWEQLARVHPQLYAYAGPRCVLYENRVRETPCQLQDYLEGRCGFTIPYCPERVPGKGIPACLKHAHATRQLFAASGESTLAPDPLLREP